MAPTQLGERRGCRRRRDAGRNRQTERAERVHRLKFTEQRQQKFMAPAEDLKVEALTAIPWLRRPDTQIGGQIGTIADNRMAMVAAPRREPRKFAAVTVQDC